MSGTGWDVIFQCCGRVYSIHLHTVCPQCLTRPSVMQAKLSRKDKS
jgi:hypothetical protein